MMLNKKRIPKIFRKITGPVIFGLLFLVSTETLLQITSFIYRHKKDRIHCAGLSDKSSNLKIMCLGESTTYGQYTAFLATELAAHNITVIDEGVPGTDTTRVLQNLPGLWSRHKPDMAVLMLGVNDVPDPENGYTRLYAGVKPGLEQKLTKICRTYAVARYLLWYFIFSKDPTPEQETKNIPMNPEFEDYHMGTRVPFLNGGQRNITTKRAEKEIEAIQKITIETKEECKEFMRDILQREEIYPEVFFEACAKVYNYIGKRPDQTKQRAIELTDFAKTLKETKANLRFQMLTKSSVSFSYMQSDGIIKKMLALSPNDPYAMCFDAQSPLNLMQAHITHPFDYTHLLSHLTHAQRYEEVIELYKQAIIKYPHLRWFLSDMAKTAYILSGQPEKAKPLVPYLPKPQPRNIHGGTYGKDVPRITIQNYNAIVDFLLEKGCTVICMQYPMRRLEVLKRIVKNKDKVFFLDNETVFKDAVSRDGYASIFCDDFASDFGHCTRRGNWLLAKNAAKTIVGILKRGH